MNIQIFGSKKDFDTKKAERYFKERRIKAQFIDMKEKGMSKGEFNSVCQAVGGYQKLIDQNCKDKDLLALITYIAEEDKVKKILDNQKIIKLPIVCNGKQATIGFQPDVWKDWKQLIYDLIVRNDINRAVVCEHDSLLSCLMFYTVDEKVIKWN